MALRMQITAFASPSPSRSRRAGFALESGSVARSGIISKAPLLGRCGSRLERKLRASVEVRLPAVGTVTEVDKDTFWPLVDAAGDRVVVLDMYTQWCGPCKLIAPKYQILSEEHLDVIFLKLDCNHENRPLAKELGIRVLPTFKIFKKGKVVKEVTGTKLDELVTAIEAARLS